jgi:molecular chaperone GrpE
MSKKDKKEPKEEVIEQEENTSKEEAKEEKPTEEIKEEDFETKYDKLNDKYLRAYADFDNTKKRLEKDKYSAIDYAIERFSKDLLEVMDSLDMALKTKEANTEISSEDMLKNLTEGVELTSKKFEKILEKYEIVKIENNGEFDPNIHNAISQVPSEDKEKGQIVEVFQDGYKLKDRVIRASMVSIAE